MRVVKLSQENFHDIEAVVQFFEVELPTRNPPGLFCFTNQIAENGLQVGELLLFTYRGRVRYIGRVQCGRRPNTCLPQNGYPNCFIVKPNTLKPATVEAAFEDIEAALLAVGVEKNLAVQAWTVIPEINGAEQAILRLLLGAEDDTEPGARCN